MIKHFLITYKVLLYLSLLIFFHATVVVFTLLGGRKTFPVHNLMLLLFHPQGLHLQVVHDCGRSRVHSFMFIP